MMVNGFVPIGQTVLMDLEVAGLNHSSIGRLDVLKDEWFYTGGSSHHHQSGERSSLNRLFHR